MASIREHVETVFAALPFAERHLTREAREVLAEGRQTADASAVAAKRIDNRPRVRV